MANSRSLLKQVITNKKTSRENNFKSRLTNNFDKNINSEKVYKNFNPNDTYIVWVYDDHSEKQDYHRKYIQMDVNDEINQGEYIHWKNREWLVRGVDKQYDCAQKGYMYECLTQQLRWVDEDGLHSFPFFAESKVLRDPLLDNKKMALIDDSAEVFLQLNAETSQIRENMRFTFGSGTIFKAIEVIDYYIDGTLKLVMKKDEAIGEDDFTSQLALNKPWSYDIVGYGESPVQGIVGNSFQLNARFVYDGEEIAHVSEWQTSDENIVTVDTDGLLTYQGNGVATITALWSGLETSVNIEVSAATGIVDYNITPNNIDKISIGDRFVFEVVKYIDGAETSLNGNYTINTTKDTFNFNVVDNTYTIENVSEMNANVVVTIEDVDNSNTVEKTYRLRAW